MRSIYLSHILSEKIPVYGGEGLLSITSLKALEKGDPANVFRFSMENHWGTHVDCPAHFFEGGRRVSDYPADSWFFKNPIVIRIDLKPGELLGCASWTDKIQSNTDLILFRSEWFKMRKKEEYSIKNPGLHPEVGFFLRDKHPSVRAVGIDWISISPFQNREVGRQAHRAFLDPQGTGNPILLIEDMDLSSDLCRLREVWVSPLKIEGIDSAPCTVMGRVEEAM